VRSSMTMMHPIFEREAAQLGATFAHRAKPLRHANRGRVSRLDEAGGPSRGKLPEQEIARGRGGLSGEAKTPEWLVQAVSNLRLRPVERFEHADGADKPAGIECFAGEHAV